MPETPPEFKTGARRMPHWEIPGSVYLITWRLANNQPALTENERDLIAGNLEHFNHDRYELYAYVVMDDHIHIVVFPSTEQTLAKLVHSWKSYTANRLQRESGRQGVIWQPDYHNRIIRSEDDLFEKCSYVITNPQRRWPEIQRYRWAKWFAV